MTTDEEVLEAKERTSAFATLLEQYLMQHFNFRRPQVSLGLSPCTVVAKTGKYDLYFRVTPPSATGWESDTLVVSRIGFQKQRKGHGRALMRFLVEAADKLPYSRIGIEQANPDAMAFGARFGFVRCGEGKDLLASVGDVMESLGQQPGAQLRVEP